MSGTQPQARVSYVAYWFDEVGRLHRRGPLRNQRRCVARTPERRPAHSDSVLVPTTQYDSSGQAYQTIHPAGQEDRRFFDAAAA